MTRLLFLLLSILLVIAQCGHSSPILNSEDEFIPRIEVEYSRDGAEYKLANASPSNRFIIASNDFLGGLSSNMINNNSAINDVLGISNRFPSLDGRKKLLVNFTCADYVSPTLCNKAQATFLNVTDMLSSILVLKNDIVVNMSFYSFCKNVTACPNENYLGSAGPSFYYYGKLTRSNMSTIYPQTDIGNLSERALFYPQALLKQLDVDKTLTFGDCDITANFNSDQNYWFPGDGPSSSTQYDFSFVVLHELIHGLGMLTSWRNSVSSSGGGYLTPLEIASNKSVTGVATQPPFVFDAYLVDQKGKSLIDYAMDIFNYQDSSSQTEAQWVTTFQGSSTGAESQEMYKEATSPEGSIRFALPSMSSGAAENITLFTISNEYAQKSSISHFGKGVSTNSTDFLMGPVLVYNVSLSSLTEKYCGGWAFGAVSPRLTRILQTLGYVVVSDIPSSYKSTGFAVQDASLGSFSVSDLKEANSALSQTKIAKFSIFIVAISSILLAF